MNDLSASSRITHGAVPVRPATVRRIRGLPDKALAWLFITPTIVNRDTIGEYKGWTAN